MQPERLHQTYWFRLRRLRGDIMSGAKVNDKPSHGVPPRRVSLSANNASTRTKSKKLCDPAHSVTICFVLEFGISRLIMKSVFRLAARRTKLGSWPPEQEATPVSEKRVGLNRSPRASYGR